jgi:ABC-type transporter Mla MlaB component
MKLAATSTVVRMDVAKLTDADNNGATLLMRALAALKKRQEGTGVRQPRSSGRHSGGETRARRAQQRGDVAAAAGALSAGLPQDAFEEAAVNYAITFEVSPPSWEALPQRVAEEPPPTLRRHRKSRRLQSCTTRCWAPTPPSLRRSKALAGREEFDVDARNLVRIDAGSAKALHEVLTRLHAAGKKLRIIGLSTLVAAYLEALGFDAVAVLRARVI